jgi:RimJ/RimL family protein N-acetyltransferase
VQWAATRIPELHGREFLDKHAGMGVEDSEGRVLGVVVFHNWDPDGGTMQVSAAADDARWLLARQAIAAMRHYVFIGCGCQKIWSITPSDNKRGLRLVRALGLRPEAVLERHLGKAHAVISRQFKEEVYGQEVRSTRAA